MFTAYLRERFPLRIYGPAAIGIVAAAGWASPAMRAPGTLIYAVAFAVLLLLQFRLWDDLEDRVHDSAAHPERLIVRTPPAPYRRALMCLTIVNVALCGIHGWPAALEIALLDLAFYVAYRRTRRVVRDAVWRFSILLIKYPAFVVILATALGQPRPGRLTAAALIAYSSACGYEALHGSLRTNHRGRGGRGGSILPFDCSSGITVVSSSVEQRRVKSTGSFLLSSVSSVVDLPFPERTPES
jgi:hypothetical protein